MRAINRRAVLHGALGAAVALAVRPALAAVSAVTNGLSLLTGAGGNIVALKTGDGAVLVDSGSATPDTPLLSLVEQATGGTRAARDERGAISATDRAACR